MVTFDKLNLPAVLPRPPRGFVKTLDANWDDLKAEQHRLDEVALAAQRVADEFGIAMAKVRSRMEPFPGMTVESVLAMLNRKASA